MSPVLYATLCVVLPAAWSIAMYFAFRWWERRRALGRGGDRPPVDYSI